MVLYKFRNDYCTPTPLSSQKVARKVTLILISLLQFIFMEPIFPNSSGTPNPIASASSKNKIFSQNKIFSWAMTLYWSVLFVGGLFSVTSTTPTSILEILKIGLL